MKKSIRERFEEKFRKTEGCWIWESAKLSTGYGIFSINNTTVYAHRVSYELYKEKIPDAKLVRHTCDNPSCVNPLHLIAGTYVENSKDMYERGRDRNLIGEDCSSALLKNDQIKDIRILIAAKAPMAWIDRQYGLSNGGTANIRDGRTWSHIL